MKNIKLLSLHIQNFKGCRDSNFSFGDSTTISGQNATGKTTIADAFMWLLFGKDSSGNTSFGIRPVDKDGKPIDNIEISVEGTFSVDDDNITFKKVSKQKWTKHRGSSAPTFEGNVNSYEVNGFPVNEKEYKAKIAEIISEDDFKLVSDLRYFSNLPWKEKKELLLRLCGDVTDEDVLASDPDYWNPISDDVRMAGVEKSRDKAKKELRELNKVQKELPVRIDEANRQLRDDVPTAGLEKELENTKKSIDELPEKLEVNVSEEREEIARMQAEIKMIEDSAVDDYRDKFDELRKAYSSKSKEYSATYDEYCKTQQYIEGLENQIKNRQFELDSWKNKYTEAKSRTFDDSATVCKYCGQVLPENQIEEIKVNFERTAYEDTQAALKQGKVVRAELDRCKALLEEKQNELTEKGKSCEKLQAEVATAKKAYDDFKPDKDPVKIQKIAELQDKCKALERTIAEREDEIKEHNNDIDNRRYALLEQLNSIQNQLSTARSINSSNNAAKARIEEITALQRDTGQKIALSEQKVILLEEFSIKKSELLSQKITSQFELANFSLFNQQINGAITEECEVTLKGVKYRDMNSGHRIVCSLDIIRTFQNLIGIHAPVFVDNAETLNDFNIPKMDCQLVLLRVTDDEKLVIS